MIELRGIQRTIRGGQSGGLGGRRDAPRFENTGDENFTQQLLKSINNQFYMHKSFEMQSDMEFLPAIVGNESEDKRGVSLGSANTGSNATGTELMANLTSLEMLMNKRLAEIQAITQRHKQQHQQQQQQQQQQYAQVQLVQHNKEPRISSPKVFDRYSPPGSRRRGSGNPNYHSYNNSNNNNNNTNNTTNNSMGNGHHSQFNRRQGYGHQNSHNGNGNGYNNQGGYNNMNQHHNFGQRNL